jgi:glyoxylase-like metal-dependent hydrolase (beta-lactamase superfamily II)
VVTHNLDFHAPYATVEQISPMVRRVLCENPGAFTFKGTATFIVGSGAVAVIDPGPAYEPHLDAILAALRPSEKVEAILVTHTHPDHSLGAQTLSQRTGAPTFGFGPHARHEEPDEEPIDFSDHISPEEQQRFVAEWEALPEELKFEGYDLDFDPQVRLTDGEAVSGPGWRLDAVHTPGHCSNHLCYGLAEEHTLFSGDHVMGWATTVITPPDGSMSEYLDSLSKVAGGNYRLMRPTHGGHIDDASTYVQDLLDHRLARENQLLAALANGPQRIVDLVPQIYAGYDKRLWYPAVGSVFAHLKGLVDTGRVRSDTNPPSRSSRFELI